MMFLDKVYIILYATAILSTLILAYRKSFNIERILTPITILSMVVFLSYFMENYVNTIVPILIGVFGCFISRLCRRNTPVITVKLINFSTVNFIIAMTVYIWIQAVEIIVR
jgi:hypothetical protein